MSTASVDRTDSHDRRGVRPATRPGSSRGTRPGKDCAHVPAEPTSWSDLCSGGLSLRRYLEDHDLGHVLSNDAGVITERDPDTVRGADVAFYSYTRLPKGPLPGNYGPEVPELVVEVRSPSDRWPKILAKVAEYLDAGVTVVVVLDDESRTAILYFSDRPSLTLKPDDELTVPEILPGFAVAVRRFFE